MEVQLGSSGLCSHLGRGGSGWAALLALAPTTILSWSGGRGGEGGGIDHWQRAGPGAGDAPERGRESKWGDSSDTTASPVFNPALTVSLFPLSPNWAASPTMCVKLLGLLDCLTSLCPDPSSHLPASAVCTWMRSWCLSASWPLPPAACPHLASPILGGFYLAAVMVPQCLSVLVADGAAASVHKQLQTLQPRHALLVNRMRGRWGRRGGDWSQTGRWTERDRPMMRPASELYTLLHHLP